jgi:glucose/arabinose dehydrogenase
MTARTRRLLVITAASVLVILAALVAFIWWGPVPVSDKRVMLDFMLGRGIAPPSETTVAERLRAPPGFRVQAYSTDVPLARVMIVTPEGDVIVSRTRGNVVSLLERDRNGDGVADGHRMLFDNLDGPHGLALHDGWLYIAERTAIGRVRFDTATGRPAGTYERVLTGLTADGFHQTKTIGFSPDGWLYLAHGSSCNVCV